MTFLHSYDAAVMATVANDSGHLRASHWGGMTRLS